MRSRRVSSKRKKSTRRLKTRVNIFKKVSDAYDSYKLNKIGKQLDKAKQKEYDLKVQNIRLRYKDRIAKSQDAIKRINNNIKKNEDEKAYYTKQKEKKEEEKKKLSGMKGKVSSDIESIRQRIQVLKNSKNVLEENREKIQQKIDQYKDDEKKKLDNLKK
jgi:hypothetical protein